MLVMQYVTTEHLPLLPLGPQFKYVAMMDEALVN